MWECPRCKKRNMGFTCECGYVHRIARVVKDLYDRSKGALDFSDMLEVEVWPGLRI